MRKTVYNYAHKPKQSRGGIGAGDSKEKKI